LCQRPPRRPRGSAGAERELLRQGERDYPEQPRGGPVMGSRPLALLGFLLAFALATPAVASPGAPGVTALTAATDRFTSEPVKRSSEPGEGSGASGAGEAGAGVVAGGPSLPRILGSLALVAGLIVGLGYAYRKLFAAQTKGGGAV